jgi:hypothetical protein
MFHIISSKDYPWAQQKNQTARSIPSKQPEKTFFFDPYKLAGHTGF